MKFGIELIKDIYMEDSNIFLNRLKEILIKNSYPFSIRSRIDFLNEPDFIFSTEKIILYKYYKNQKAKDYLPLNKQNVYLFNLVGLDICNLDYIYPLAY